MPVSASVIHLYLLLAEITQLGKQSCSITPGFDSWPIWLLVDSQCFASFIANMVNDSLLSASPELLKFAAALC